MILRDQVHRELVYRAFQFQKRSQLFIGTHNETLSIEDDGGGVPSVLAVSNALTRFSDRPRSFGLR
jgi:hypothetical protein